MQDFFQILETLGHVPLPPYISRDDRPADQERYQTVYARERGSVAAPTAGLHFTPDILSRLRERGIQIAELTLHVGLGTFQPIRVQSVEEHRLHQEAYTISPETAEAVNRARLSIAGSWRSAPRRFARLNSRRLSLRAAESSPVSGEADLFIYPGYRFQVVDAMLTNFHLPESTLLMLVCAFAGREPVLDAYRHAVQQGYRFYSYGDCMFVE